jgi:protein-tyrosine phosphatase
MTKKLILKGTPNFRDLGGIPATDGRIVRYGVLYRSEGPEHLTKSDVVLLRRVNFRLIFDLRSKGERLTVPNLWCEGTHARIVNLNVTDDLRAAGNEMWKVISNDTSEKGVRKAMIRNYCAMTKTMIPHLHLLFDEILDKDALPVLIHCTAGKDRTGFIVALLLLALGIDRSTVKADYLLSSQFLGERFRSSISNLFVHHIGFRPRTNIMNEMLQVRQEYLDAALTTINDVAGSVENYLREYVGLSEVRTKLLREKLLVSTCVNS